MVENWVLEQEILWLDNSRLERKMGISFLPSMYGIRSSRGFFLMTKDIFHHAYWGALARSRDPIETSRTAFRLSVFSRHFISSRLLAILILIWLLDKKAIMVEIEFLTPHANSQRQDSMVLKSVTGDCVVGSYCPSWCRTTSSSMLMHCREHWPVI